ncbi:hypothetical protein FANTH_10139 [Fusarium anthophilum]|uniref:Nucleoside phosphorylase domain-containing protein n=1 Tax=Fusarium anthophilum TaxID=48485 RepID=A0A8H5DXF2_9HYPO|nr:hypothetical protein FANTH_10139 [Fusarium anthophilum]
MLRSFPNIHIGLMVGIGGGVPTTRNDVRLGYVVVGDLIVQYDLGRTVSGGKFERSCDTGNPPSDHLVTAVKSLQARQDLQTSRVSRTLEEIMANHPSFELNHARPAELNRLFVGDHVGDCNGESVPCASCDPSQLVQRLHRPNADCKVHHGKIASGNQVIKHRKTRDRLSYELDVICFEMVAAGLLDANLPCLVIRGISDYADSHKNDKWRGYAAATADAYSKVLLATIPAVIPKGLSFAVSMGDSQIINMVSH